ncbi:MAG: family 20 glycosylhydrolase [Clostridia bacterium]|nr:family 20 glycosylhydrolase [Clostridia bacterium]
MFFEPVFWEKKEPVLLSAGCAIEGAEGYAAEVLERLIGEYGETGGSVGRIVMSGTLPEFYPLSDREEGYALELFATEAHLYGETPRARIYAAVTLLQMATAHELFCGRLYDAPDCPFRGYRVFLPGRASMDAFKEMVKTIAYYKYNALSLEVGGAMEYHRHPEINEAWAEFVKENRRYSGRAHEIQDSQNWKKNSIHPDNGDGDILTQNEVREIIAFCRAHGIEVYPEVPLMSHADYICLAHREIAERQDDPWPDTYCPNHPDTYKIVFDILEEVIEVFEPKVVNIGHDELYTAAVCPRCKGQYPHELYARDITRIYDWLKERGIRTMMAGEKLLPVVTPEGRLVGGAGGPDRKAGKKSKEDLPVLFYCQYMLPKDIIMLNWYGRFGIQYDYVYHTHGYPVVYANMYVPQLPHWRHRIELGVKGGTCANWGSNDPRYMQRNTQYLALVLGAYALWSKEYDDGIYLQTMKKTYEECFRLKYGDLTQKPYITVTHTTDLLIPYKPFYDGDFIVDEEYRLGAYRLTYTDGTACTFPVSYGDNIASADLSCSFEDDTVFDGVNPTAPALGEVSYSTIPCVVDGKTYYKTAFLNPHPEKEIASFEYVSEKDATVTVHQAEYNGKKL